MGLDDERCWYHLRAGKRVPAFRIALLVRRLCGVGGFDEAFEHESRVSKRIQKGADLPDWDNHILKTVALPDSMLAD